MIYHPLQLIVCSILAERYASQHKALASRQEGTLINAR